VSPDSLRALAGRLDDIHSELTATGSVISGYRGLLGSPDVDNALDDFFSNWSDGMNKIEGHLDGVVQRLRAAADAYEQTDQAIERAATPNQASA
jgi:hypothetical protein